MHWTENESRVYKIQGQSSIELVGKITLRGEVVRLLRHPSHEKVAVSKVLEGVAANSKVFHL